MKTRCLSLALIGILVTAACSGGEDAHAKEIQRSLEQAGENLKDAAGAMMGYAWKKRDELGAEMRSRFSELESDLAEYRERASQLSGEAGERATAKAAELEKELETAKQRLDGLADASEDAWGEARDGTVQAWEELRRSLDDARSKLE